MSASDLHLWHPFTQEGVDPPPLSIRSGKGVFIETQDGRQILDAISSWWVNIHGHSHPAIAQAIAEQAARLEHVLFAGFSHEPAEELAVRLGKVVPAPLRHVFFSDDGSTAVEVALKLAAAILEKFRAASEAKNRRARKRLPRRYGGRDVGERRFAIHRGIRVFANSCLAHAFGLLRALPCRPHARDLPDRMPEQAGALAFRTGRRNRRRDCRAAASGRGRDDRSSRGISFRSPPPDRRSRCAADCGRSPHRLRANRPHVCLRASRSGSRSDVRRQRPDRRISAIGRDVCHRSRFTTHSRAAIARARSSTATPTLPIQSPAPRRMRLCEFSRTSRSSSGSPRLKKCTRLVCPRSPRTPALRTSGISAPSRPSNSRYPTRDIYLRCARACTNIS